MWNSEIKTQLVANNGSVQNIKKIPDDLKKLYKTVWEISQKSIINLAIGRGKYIDQSQSLNIHLSDPNNSKISSMHFYAWKSGLKTGMYYLRSRPAVDAIKFTLNVEELLKASDGKDTEKMIEAIGKMKTEDTISLSKNTESPTNGNKNNGEKTFETKTNKEEEEGCISCSG